VDKNLPVAQDQLYVIRKAGDNKIGSLLDGAFDQDEDPFTMGDVNHDRFATLPLAWSPHGNNGI
jgi:hypothetical protein